MQVQKKGIRVLGIAESFRSRDRSWLCGVVMRRDMVIDGMVFGDITVGGSDATGEVIRMIHSIERQDLTCIMMSGCIIAWYNIIDPDVIADATGYPVICTSYEASEGLEGHITHHFPGSPERMAAYLKLGRRKTISLRDGSILYARGSGLSDSDMTALCRMFVHQGKIPEPCRVARLCARALMNRVEQDVRPDPVSS